jgi:hypothetical protein
MRRSRRDMADDIPQLRKEIEEQRARLDKQAALTERVDALMTRVYEDRERRGLMTAAQIAELLAPQLERLAEKHLGRVQAKLEELAAQRAAQCAEFAESLAAQRELRNKLGTLLAQLEARTPTETALTPRRTQ